MTEPSPPRPLAGPPRSVPGPGPAQIPTSSEADGPGEGRFADLADLPVAEHVAVFEAEQSRLQRELGTIDQL